MKPHTRDYEYGYACIAFSVAKRTCSLSNTEIWDGFRLSVVVTQTVKEQFDVNMTSVFVHFLWLRGALEAFSFFLLQIAAEATRRSSRSPSSCLLQLEDCLQTFSRNIATKTNHDDETCSHLFVGSQCLWFLTTLHDKVGKTWFLVVQKIR